MMLKSHKLVVGVFASLFISTLAFGSAMDETVGAASPAGRTTAASLTRKGFEWIEVTGSYLLGLLKSDDGTTKTELRRRAQEVAEALEDEYAEQADISMAGNPFLIVAAVLLEGAGSSPKFLSAVKGSEFCGALDFKETPTLFSFLVSYMKSTLYEGGVPSDSQVDKRRITISRDLLQEFEAKISASSQIFSDPDAAASKSAREDLVRRIQEIFAEEKSPGGQEQLRGIALGALFSADLGIACNFLDYNRGASKKSSSTHGDDNRVNVGGQVVRLAPVSSFQPKEAPKLLPLGLREYSVRSMISLIEAHMISELEALRSSPDQFNEKAVSAFGKLGETTDSLQPLVAEHAEERSSSLTTFQEKLQANIQALQDLSQELQTQSTQANRDLSDKVQVQVQAFEVQAEVLRTALKGLYGLTSRLKAKNVALQGQVEDLQRQLKAEQDDHEETKAERGALQGQVAAFSLKISGLFDLSQSLTPKSE